MVENVTRVSKGQQLSNNILFNILSNERRRFTLYCLEKYQTPIALADLADEIALLESNAETLLDIPADDVKETYLDLYHCQIPKLEEVDLLTYSQKRDTVSLKHDLSDLSLEKFL